MSGKAWIALLVVGGIALGALIWYNRVINPPLTQTASAATTKLRVEISGGFAYVPPTGSDNHLEVAYLNNWTFWTDANGNGTMEPNEIEYDDLNGNGSRDAGEPDFCTVHQLGTKLKVTKGTIISHDPASQTLPGDYVFDLDKTVVKFTALETANLPLTVGNMDWPPPDTEPSDPNDESKWEKMVPRLLKKHTGKTIDPNWRTLVNGRMVLPGGNIKATFPSGPVFKKAKFDFKQNKVSQFKAAMTDKTIYTVDVPAATVVIELNGPAGQFTRLVVQPQGNTVELTLTGNHDMGSPIPGDGDPLKDFCTFYQLMQPRPTKAEFFVPHYLAPTAGSGGGGGLPSPGFFCPGDWF